MTPPVMPSVRSAARRGQRRVWSLVRSSAGIGLALCLLPAAAAAAPVVSSNWAGYAAHVTGRTDRFRSVSGVWRQPVAACTGGRESYVGVWVGLGGYAAGSRALEQIGTDSDCTRAGRPVYEAWLELVPAAPLAIPLRVHAGDTIAASVTVRGRSVTLRIRDLTSGARFASTRRAPAVDVSSAEWIVEAPSSCLGARPCATLPLTDFGSTSFFAATATTRGRARPAQGPGWSLTELELRQGPGTMAVQQGRASTSFPAPVAAVPSLLGPDGAFSVTWVSDPGAQVAAVAAPGGAFAGMLRPAGPAAGSP